MIAAGRGWSASILLAATALLLGVAASSRHEPATAAVDPRRDRDSSEVARQLTGRVVDDATGHPLPGATVGTSLDLSHFVRTDGVGRFTLGLPDERPVNLYAYAPGMATTHLADVHPGQGALTLRLVVGARVIGRLLVESWREPLLVSVCGEPADPNATPGLCVARLLVRESDTTPPGSFSLAALPAGDFSLWVERGERVLARRAVALRAGSTTDLGELATARD